MCLMMQQNLRSCWLAHLSAFMNLITWHLSVGLASAVVEWHSLFGVFDGRCQSVDNTKSHFSAIAVWPKIPSGTGPRESRLRHSARLQMGDLPEAASRKRKSESGGEFVLGDDVDYYCKHAKTWKPTKVIKISKEGITVKCRSTRIPQAQVQDRLRPKVQPDDLPMRAPRRARAGSAPADSADAAGVSADAAGFMSLEQLSRRSRGTYDGAFGDAGAKWLVACKSVKGIMQKFKERFRSTGARRKLRDAILNTFPELEDSCKNFRGHPGSDDVDGCVHPWGRLDVCLLISLASAIVSLCYRSLWAFSSGSARGSLLPPGCRCMLAIDPAAWDAFHVYQMDFLKELRVLASEGCADSVLTLRPLAHIAAEGEDWSDFRWQPDGSYFSFVQLSVIVFVVVIVSMQADLSTEVPSVPQLVVPAWLRRDLGALKARFQHRGDDKERTLGIIKSTLALSGRHRSLDPLMLHSVLSTASLPSESKLSQFLDNYQHMVRYDATLLLPEHLIVPQWNLMSPTRSQSLVADSPSSPPLSPSGIRIQTNPSQDKHPLDTRQKNRSQNTNKQESRQKRAAAEGSFKKKGPQARTGKWSPRESRCFHQ